MHIQKCPVNRNPKESANIFSVLTFWWLKDIFKKGLNKTLTLDDIYEPLKFNQSENLGNLLEREWRREWEKLQDFEYVLEKDGNKKLNKDIKPSLYKALYRIFWRKYFLISGFLFVHTVILYTLQPILQGWIINYFNVSSTNSKTVTKEKVIIYCFGLVIDIIVSVCIFHHVYFKSQEIGMQIRIACSSLIYKKILRLSKTALMQTTNGGQILNILSNDMNRFDTVLIYLHYLWIGPIQLVVVTYIMWTMIGSSTFFGIACLLLVSFPIQGYFPVISKKLRASLAVLTDTRIQLINEFITGIQMIKMYGWEKPFSKFVITTRIAEMKKIRISSFIKVLALSMLIFTERMTLYFSMVSYALTNKTLNPEYTYVWTTFFNILQLTIVMFFLQALISWNETTITINRIEEFLLLDEVISNDQTSLMSSMSSKYEKKGDKNDIEYCRIILKKEEPVINVEPKKQPSIELIKVSSNWVSSKLPPTLCNISMKVDPGQLCILLGQVGSGKTALLNTLLKELPLGAGTIKILQNLPTKGDSHANLTNYFTDNKNIRFSYASQEPWLFGGTIKENILFGELYDNKRYTDVTRVCALNKDFQQLPQGDMTTVGERGIMLSGGQKARVSLARAIYKQADIYLLDDPLSAVDTKVAKHIFTKCIVQYLRDKTRILATHQLQFIKSADVIMALDHGTVKMKGNYNELMKNNDEFLKMVTRIKMERENNEIKEDTNENLFGYNRDSIRSRASIRSYNSSVVESVHGDYENADTNEQEELFLTKNIPWKLYVKYFRYGGSWLTLIIFVIISIVTQIITNATDYWVSYWTNLEVIRSSKNKTLIMNKQEEYRNTIQNTILSNFISLDNLGLLTTTSAIYIYTILIVICIITVLVRSIFFMQLCVIASRKIHNDSFNNLLQANMRFFHTNPSGRILNRFSKDMGAVDELLPKPMIEVIQISLVTLGIIIIEIIVNYWTIIPFIILGIFTYFIKIIYVRTVQSIKRYESICKSPIFCHVGTTLNGLSTIRSSGKATQDLLQKKFDYLQDKHTGTWYLLLAASALLGLVFDILISFVIAFICFYFVLVPTDNTLSGDVGLAISQALIIISMLQYGIKQSIEVIIQMTSVERIFQYMDLPKEKSLIITNPLPPTWPSQGRLILKNVSMRYSPNEPPVLKNLTVTIEAGWKVGIVGRTGAGKSSLISALFRLFSEGLEGEIIIDEKDTSTIDLQQLRSRISIIPQEPILFAASLRYNLDPFKQYDDIHLWDVLREVEFTDIGLNDQILSNGNNLSIGQKQLICLARSMLRKNRIIVLDEATANIDSQTDELIQRTLRTKFVDYTVLCVAHRLNTIIDSNRIIVMDGGEIAEFDHPYELLRNKPNGLFAQMVNNTGRIMSKNLLQQAEMAYRRDTKEHNLDDISTETELTINTNQEYISL
ncbi:multidrug resistance-associated protein 4-like isoform X2 [Vespa mandarinia]|uniref:multidrug resistance-associated protein 4-like isoform X2 n=1 Tax=Vespa mandarinia TaxID=7446 RepID=UPI001611722F|nr:multidrug resistance-associated protein 4-like isoform X2 [Vespa mandarinia]